ncbi:toll/interleukin-1 receptor domain-containing protein [Parafrankia sp. BMG5.11]|uniref:toll/interleukin-1 receptor domain-containing protein n=1 Tax=Parafrankia sp. BMG5.11 TaxID=222540 RepID=UPI00103D435D|nr:toll/interleukin-1 receptor domain-containing protein [Parafrankia sp. BMG5.11]TCJ33339.1 toll/interleukin-1 receptor domain-containing protein [Parafrankia sp. BMG5.11]
MQVFLSWSGGDMKEVAELLNEWMPTVLQSAKPWVSSQDISSGSRSMGVLADELAHLSAGIICISNETQSAPWINFEAGALSKFLDKALVIPFLVGLSPANLKGPLSQFQAVDSSSKTDVARMLSAINLASPSPVPENVLTRSVERGWSELAERLDKIRLQMSRTKPTVEAPLRSTRELVEELLLITRKQHAQSSQIAASLATHRSHAEILGILTPVAGSASASNILVILGRFFPLSLVAFVADGKHVRISIPLDIEIPALLTKTLEPFATSFSIELTTEADSATIESQQSSLKESTPTPSYRPYQTPASYDDPWSQPAGSYSDEPPF